MWTFGNRRDHRLVRRRWRLFQNHVAVRSAEPEGADAREAARPVARPGMRLLDRDEERRAGNGNPRVELLEVKRRRNLLVMQNERGLQKTRDSGRRFEVADVRLGRPDGTPLFR